MVCFENRVLFWLEVYLFEMEYDKVWFIYGYMRGVVMNRG